MKKRLLPALLLAVLVALSWISTLDVAASLPTSIDRENYENSYKFEVQNGFYQSSHTLYVSLPPSLREYYKTKNHILYGMGNYAKFVTPDAFQSIAENIRNLTRNTPYDQEEFANAVLTIVRQITYVRNDVKYPLETIVDNQADCDGLSLLAASMLKAGGLDVILLLYDDIFPAHMNIGVSLERMPVSHSWWVTPSGVEYNNKTYWIGECTSLADWTVGNLPALLADDRPKIIPLENCEKESPAVVSSSLDNPMQPSSISINLAADNSDANGEQRILIVTGSISPALPNRTITCYINQPTYSRNPMFAVTDDFGNYTLIWNVSSPGTYELRTTWSGNSTYAGSDSETLTVLLDSQRPTIAENSISFGDEKLPGVLNTLRAREILKGSVLGTEVVLSGDFMVLSDGHELTPDQILVTIPAHKVAYRAPRSRQTVILQVPEKTMPLPGAEQLNNQFGFTLARNQENNFSVSVKLLKSDDVSQITQSLQDSRAVFVNASDTAMKNLWHRAVANISDGKAVMSVFDENGNLLERKETADLSDLGVFVSYPVGQVIALKNLRVETVSQRQNSIPINKDATVVGNYDFLFPYIKISLLLLGVVLAAVCLKDRRTRTASKPLSQ